MNWKMFFRATSSSTRDLVFIGKLPITEVLEVFFNKFNSKMFKVSQEIYLKESDSINHNSIYGKYQDSGNNDDTYNFNDKQIFVAPELAEIDKIQILHFPDSGKCFLNDTVNFIVKKNSARGNLDLKLTTSNGKTKDVSVKILDPDRYGVTFPASELGIYRIQIKFNGVELMKSPYQLEVIDTNQNITTDANKLPIFHSDANLIKSRGIGLTHIVLNEKNEFTIDASSAGNNILFVGICGPKGQCDEVFIKHVGQNVYNVSYRIEDRGNYCIIAKWGDAHIPGSPFMLNA